MRLSFTILLTLLLCFGKAHGQQSRNIVSEQNKFNGQDFESAKSKLKVRIYDDATIAQKGGAEKLVALKQIEGTLSLLMIDLGNAFIPVTRQQATTWQVNDTTLFNLALLNINREQVSKVTKTFDIDHNNIEVSFIGNEDYAASYALDLARNSPELVGQWGAVVAIPNKGIAAVCKVSRDKPFDFVKFIQRLKAAIEQYYTQSPYPVTKNFQWYYQGKFTPILVTTMPNGEINVIAPLAMSELMLSSDK